MMRKMYLVFSILGGFLFLSQAQAARWQVLACRTAPNAKGIYTKVKLVKGFALLEQRFQKRGHQEKMLFSRMRGKFFLEAIRLSKGSFVFKRIFQKVVKIPFLRKPYPRMIPADPDVRNWKKKRRYADFLVWREAKIRYRKGKKQKRYQLILTRYRLKHAFVLRRVFRKVLYRRLLCE